MRSDVKPPLTYKHKELLLAVLIRNRKAMSIAMAQSDLTPAVWQNAAGLPLRLLWDKLSAYFTEHEDVPPRLVLEAELETLNNILNEDEIKVIHRVVDVAFGDASVWAGEDVANSQKCVNRACDVLRRMLLESLAAEAKQRLGNSVDDLPGTFELLGIRANRILTAGVSSEGRLFPDGQTTQKQVRGFIPTGLEMMDLMLDGGGLAGEVYGFMAPYGGGKTLLANQGFCMTARLIDADFQNQDVAPWEVPAVVMVSFEECRADIQERALMLLADVPRGRILSWADQGPYDGDGTTGDMPLSEIQYRQKCQKEQRPYVNEAKRVQAAIDLCNRYGVFIDLSGQDDDSMGGEEGVAGIARRLEKLLTVEGRRRPLRCIFIDHLAAMTAQRREAGLLNKEDVPEFIANAPIELKKRICGPYQCFGWFLHQLDVTGNRAGAASRVDHTQSADGKAFGRYCNFCFQCPRPDENGRFVLWCTKHRRTPPRSSRVLQIVDGILLRDCSEQFTLDTLSGTIVARSSSSMWR